MAKKKVQDVVASRSIRKIALKDAIHDPEKPVDVPKVTQLPRKSSKKRNLLISQGKKWFLSGTLILVFIVAVLTFFSEAYVKVKPRQQNITFNNVLIAKRDASNTELKYDVMTLSREVHESVKATEEEKVETRARGSLIIYNTFSTGSQKLVVGTRLQSASGLMYRLEEPVTVPGRVVRDGKTIPGSIEVSIVADKAGEEYNMNLESLKGDFKIPGFNGTPRYDGFYARLKTDITGGFSGVRKIISQGKSDSIRQKAQADLKDQLLKQAYSQKPDGFILFKDAYSISFSESVSNQDDDAIRISHKATLYGVIMKHEDFNRYVAEHILKDTFNNNYSIQDVENLDFIASQRDMQRPQDSNAITFTLKGDTRIIWKYSENKLRSDLVNIPVKSVVSILKDYPTILSATVSMRPFWMKTLPMNPSKIKIQTIVD